MAKKVRQPRRQQGSAAADEGRRPEVIVDFVFDDGLFFIAIENIGERSALDVSVAFDKKFHGAGDEQAVTSLPLFRGIPFLAPRRHIRTFLDSSAAYFARGEPTKLTATVVYRDSAGNKYEDVIRHDLEIYRDIKFLWVGSDRGQTGV